MGMPKHLDATKAFQGGKEASTTIAATMMTKTIQSANLTPDVTGLMGWTANDIVTAITMAKDNKGRTLCSPMRAFSTMSASDAMDVASYLTSIPPVANMITETCM